MTMLAITGRTFAYVDATDAQARCASDPASAIALWPDAALGRYPTSLVNDDYSSILLSTFWYGTTVSGWDGRPRISME